MRKCYNGFDVFEIVRINKREEYLYMTHDELFQKKLKTDEDIINWKPTNKSEKYYFEYVFPDPSIMYSLNLIESAIISVVIEYKLINLARLESKCIMQENKQEITEFLITAIKEEPKISYMDLIDLGNEKDRTSKK